MEKDFHYYLIYDLAKLADFEEAAVIAYSSQFTDDNYEGQFSLDGEETFFPRRIVGFVDGTIFVSDATTPALGAEVILKSQSALFNGLQQTKFADALGRFSFSNVAVGPYTLSVKAAALGASADGSIAANGETDNVTLVLGASGSVVGRLVRADGSNAVAGVDAVLTFSSQSGLPGIAVSRSDASGAFAFANIPFGAFNFEAIAPGFGGIARFASLISGQWHGAP